MFKIHLKWFSPYFLLCPNFFKRRFLVKNKSFHIQPYIFNMRLIKSIVRIRKIKSLRNKNIKKCITIYCLFYDFDAFVLNYFELHRDKFLLDQKSEGKLCYVWNQMLEKIKAKIMSHVNRVQRNVRV